MVFLDGISIYFPYVWLSRRLRFIHSELTNGVNVSVNCFCFVLLLSTDWLPLKKKLFNIVGMSCDRLLHQTPILIFSYYFRFRGIMLAQLALLHHSCVDLANRTVSCSICSLLEVSERRFFYYYFYTVWPFIELYFVAISCCSFRLTRTFNIYNNIWSKKICVFGGHLWNRPGVWSQVEVFTDITVDNTS